MPFRQRHRAAQERPQNRIRLEGITQNSAPHHSQWTDFLSWENRSDLASFTWERELTYFMAQLTKQNLGVFFPFLVTKASAWHHSQVMAIFERYCPNVTHPQKEVLLVRSL